RRGRAAQRTEAEESNKTARLRAFSWGDPRPSTQLGSLHPIGLKILLAAPGACPSPCPSPRSRGEGTQRRRPFQNPLILFNFGGKYSSPCPLLRGEGRGEGQNCRLPDRHVVYRGFGGVAIWRPPGLSRPTRPTTGE